MFFAHSKITTSVSSCSIYNNYRHNMIKISLIILSILLSIPEACAFAPYSRTKVDVPFKSMSFSAHLGQSSSLHLSSSVVEETETDQRESDASLRSYLDDGFVFGLQGSGIERPKGKEAKIVVEGDSLETTPYQIGLVSITFASHLLFMGLNIAELLQVNGGNAAITAVQSIMTIAASWILADLGSGILHWSVDNYGNGRTPVMGSIIAAFQGHHAAPWTITERGFCNNVYKLCIPFGIPTVALITAITGPITSIFFTVFCALEILSQELHKWSHMTKKQVPGWVNWMQQVGLSINRKDHANHHTEPYEGNYCIVSGICNGPLDNSGFFRRLERIVYNINGVESNAWKLDPVLKEKTLRGDYSI